MFGRIGPVFAALRTSAPEVDSAVCDYRADDGGLYLRVSYRRGVPRAVIWDDLLAAYRWQSGPDAPQPLGADPLQAAETIVRSLGAPMTGRPR